MQERSTVDDGVVAAATRGDQDALAALWRAWNPAVLRFLGARGAASPEDSASEVWIDLARALPTIGATERDVVRVLFTIARRRLIDEHRRRPLPLPVDELDAAPASAADAPVMERASTDAAVALVRRLPPDQAEAVLLRHLVGLDVQEVAAVMDRNATTVRVLVHRGLRRLEDLVDPDGSRRRAAERRFGETPGRAPAMEVLP